MERRQADKGEGGVYQVLGYEVIKNDNEESNIAYFLKGRRVIYRLIRTEGRLEFLFAVNSRLNKCSVKGHYYFTDKDGRLTTAIEAGLCKKRSRKGRL